MRRLRRFLVRLAASVTRRRDEQRLREEIKEHLDLQTAENISGGMTPDEARRQAVLKFGAVEAVKENWRDQTNLLFLEQVLQDARHALRGFRQNPGFTAIAVVTLALGIGANTAVFSVIDAALLRPMPYPQPDRIVDIHVERPEPTGESYRLSPSMEDIRDWQAHARVFSHVAASHVEFRPPVLDGPVPQRVKIRYITDEYLELHGVMPFIGRSIQRADLSDGAPDVALLGYGFWRTRFDGDRSIVGRAVRINDTETTIIGVLPAQFHVDSQLWRPYRRSPVMFAMRGSGATVLGRLRENVTIDDAQRSLSRLTVGLDDERGRTQAKGVRASGVIVRSRYETITEDYGDTSMILAAAALLILLIACVNVAGLMLARGFTRRAELAVRTAIGAGRSRLVRQLITESLLLSAVGGMLGVLLAWMSLDLLVANVPITLPENVQVAVNRTVLVFAVLLCVFSGLAFGSLPALNLSRVSLRTVLATGGQRHSSGLSRRAGQILAAVEVTLAVLLMVGASLMIRSFARVLDVNIGFDASAFSTLEVVPVDQHEASLRTYYPALLERLRQRPGVEAAGAIDHLPLQGSIMKTSVTVNGTRVLPTPNIHQFLPGVFEAMGFLLKQGRWPTDSDMREALPVALVSESAARLMFPGSSPIGQEVRVGPKNAATFRIVGVIRDVRHRGPLRDIEPDLYVAWGHLFQAQPLMVVARTRNRIDAQLREAAQIADTPVIVERVRRGSDWLSERVAEPRQRTVLLGLFGGIGFLLVLVGVFGVTAYAVAQRTNEIGVRMAFGAASADVVTHILRDSVAPLALGLFIGLAAASGAAKVMSSILFETETTDLVAFGAAGITLAIASLIAAWLPARRAARVDPLVALRYE